MKWCIWVMLCLSKILYTDLQNLYPCHAPRFLWLSSWHRHILAINPTLTKKVIHYMVYDKQKKCFFITNWTFLAYIYMVLELKTIRNNSTQPHGSLQKWTRMQRRTMVCISESIRKMYKGFWWVSNLKNQTQKKDANTFQRTPSPCCTRDLAITALDCLHNSSALVPRIGGWTITFTVPGLSVPSQPFGISFPVPIKLMGTTGTFCLAAIVNAPLYKHHHK